MGEEKRVELDSREVGSVLSDYAGRLRVYAHAVQHMAALEGARDTPEYKAKAALAAQLVVLAEQLEVVRRSLCTGCAMTDIVDEQSVRRAPPDARDAPGAP